MAEKLRLMAVHAHPDDESSKGTAAMVRYLAEGHEVMVVSCTGGERGSFLNPAMKHLEGTVNMTELRRTEMAKAIKILGVQHRWLGFTDSGLPEGDPLPALPEGCFALVPLAESTEALVKVIREFRPHVLTTYDENGGYPHPDHIRSHEVAVAAFDAAGDPDLFPQAGPAWQPLKLYYSHELSRKKMVVFHEATIAHGLQSPYTAWLNNWDAGGQDVLDRVTTRVECADYFSIAREALLAHASQIDPNNLWFNISPDLQREVWPTEDFELVRSLVDSTLPENDLFAGIRERVLV